MHGVGQDGRQSLLLPRTLGSGGGMLGELVMDLGSKPILIFWGVN